VRGLHAWCFVGLVEAAASASWARPDWGRPREVSGRVLYPDHERPRLWYYVPAEPRLADRDGAPAFRFDLFRYVGRQETGDAGAHRVRAVLSLELEREDAGVDELRRGLAEPNAVELRRVPADRVETALEYAHVEAEAEATSASARLEGGVLHGVDASDAAAHDGAWTQRRYTVALQPLTADLFWQGFETDRLLLSASYRQTSMGVVWDEAAGRFVPRDKVWSSSVPIRVSRRRHPQLFTRHETWATLRMAQTRLLVLCYDFVDEKPTPLHRVDVEVKIRTKRRQEYVEPVRFEAGQAVYEREVSFRLAKDLDEPYAVRVTRLYVDRPREQSDWTLHRAQQIDVSRGVGLEQGEETR